MQVRTLRYVKRQQQGFLKTALNMIARFEALRNSRNSRPAQFFLNIDLSLSKDLVQGSVSKQLRILSHWGCPATVSFFTL